MELLQNPENIYNYLLEILQKEKGELNEISGLRPISGGSINEAYEIITDKESYFLKINSAAKFPGMFEAEAKGLKILWDTNTFTIPVVQEIFNWNNLSGLIMDFLPSGLPGGDFSFDFARKLVGLHSNSHSKFGLDHTNYMGSLIQNNDFRSSWPEFFTEYRIEPLFQKAYDAGKLSERSKKKLTAILQKLDEWIPVEKPALLHGDLWSGNYMIDESGAPVLIDPAVYYGHREMDLAMMKLFGGFSSEIFYHYHELFPLEKDWEERLPIHQLYPLLVHIILFGGNYIDQFNRIVDDFA